MRCYLTRCKTRDLTKNRSTWMDRNGVLMAFFHERSVPCLNFLPAFRQLPDTYAPHDTHWNVAGNHLAAREIAAFLVKSGSD